MSLNSNTINQSKMPPKCTYTITKYRVLTFRLPGLIQQRQIGDMFSLLFFFFVQTTGIYILCKFIVSNGNNLHEMSNLFSMKKKK